MRPILVFAVAVLLHPVCPAQSLWQKIKQQAQETERQAKATQSHTTAATAGSAGPKSSSHRADDGPQGTPQLTDQLAKSMPAFEVAGIRLGESVKDAMAALKAHNSVLSVTPHPITFELIPNQHLLPEVEADEPVTDTTPHEEVYVRFTMAPNTPFVDGIQRNFYYPKGTEPSMQKTLAAIHATYGAPSIPPANPASPEFQWFYDSSGKQLTGSKVAYVPRNCDINAIDTAPNIVSRGYQPKSDFEGERHGETCGAYTVLIMRLQVANSPSGEKVVTFISTSAVAGPLYRSAAQATHTQYLAAQQVKDRKDNSATQQNQVSF